MTKVCKSSLTNTKVSSVCSSASSFSSLRPTIAILLGNKCTIDVIVGTGADVSFLNIADYAVFCFNRDLQPVRQTFQNFDGSRIQLRGCISEVGTQFNNKSATCTFYVADVPWSIIGMDIICALRLNISCNIPSKFTTTPIAATKVCGIDKEKLMIIHLKDNAPSTLISPVRRLPFAMEEPVELEIQKLLAADVKLQLSSLQLSLLLKVTAPFVCVWTTVGSMPTLFQTNIQFRRSTSCLAKYEMQSSFQRST